MAKSKGNFKEELRKHRELSGSNFLPSEDKERWAESGVEFSILGIARVQKGGYDKKSDKWDVAVKSKEGSYTISFASSAKRDTEMAFYQSALKKYAELPGLALQLVGGKKTGKKRNAAYIIVDRDEWKSPTGEGTRKKGKARKS